jgi:thiamine-monophosphate kinase
MNEREFIRWIQARSPALGSRVIVGPGDDCAVVEFAGRPMLITTDQVLDGVHFLLGEHGPRAAGRKAMARNLSDIAAMAGSPVAAVASVAIPRDFADPQAQEIYEGLRSMADEFACPLVGGDIAVWDRPLAVSVTAVGEMPAGRKPVPRSGARQGEAICVTGALGGAWRGSRHLHFTPRIAAAGALADDWRVAAMIDISDGLAADLHHVCDASGVAAEVVAADVPIHEDAAIGGTDPLAAALGDGEDYELLFTLDARLANELCRAQPLDVRITRIGTISAGRGVTLVAADGTARPLAPAGWEHTTD